MQADRSTSVPERNVKDKRILEYRDAIEAMQEFRFNISVTAGCDDDLGRLGGALNRLAGALNRRFEEEEKLSRVTERANAGLILEEVLNFVYEAFGSIIPFERVGLALIEKGGERVQSRWARSEASDIRLPEGYSAPLEGSSLQEIIRTGKPRILNDLESYLAEHPQSDSTRRIIQEGMRSSLTCPLIALGKPIGFIFFSSKKANTYERLHEQLFLRIAGQLSMIVEKSRLYGQVMELNHQLLEVQSELEHQATHDALTGVWNRGAILEALEKELARSCRESRPLSVVLADIDFFKALNDTYGHQAGDAVLKEVARRLSSALRSAEWVGRYGGEEFLIVLYPSDESAAFKLMERLRENVSSKPVELDGETIHTTISLGAAVGHGTDSIEAGTLIRIADKALYRAKDAGRNRSELLLVNPPPSGGGFSEHLL
jgi:diguanylate cyclase (GGDEF)-like protein